MKTGLDSRLVIRVVKDYILITIGAVIMSLGLLWFLDPYKVSAGGVSGISIILRNQFGIPLGIGMLAMNIPLFLLGVFFLGRRFGIRTFYGFTIFSISVDVIDKMVYDKLLGYEPYLLSSPGEVDILRDLDPLLAAIFGGVLLGAGLGLVFRAQGSTGGSDIIAQISVKHRFLTAGQTFLVFDFFVITAAAIVFGGVGYALIGFVALFVSSKTLDVIVEGIGNTKGLYIVSDEWKIIKDRIMKELDRGTTIMHGQGGYSEKEKEVIFCVVTRRSIYKVRQIVIEHDPKAFMVISDLHEVYGLGFKPQKEEETPI